jgi:TPR repeat protein
MRARFALFSIGWSDLAIRYLRGVFAAPVFAAAAFGLLAASAEARDPLWDEVPWEERLGVEWFEKRAERGNTEAQLNLAKMYEQGIGTDPDLARAAKWYEAAALSGNAEAQFRLASLLSSGRMGVADFAAAVRWFRAASDQGVAAASFNLAVMAEQGLGMPEDDAFAADRYEMAFGQGMARAALMRGLLALNAEPPRGVEALEWFLRANSAGVAEARVLAESAASQLNEEQRESARLQAEQPPR